MPFPTTTQQRGDYEADVKFAYELFFQFKLKNISEGINAHQSLWLHHRTKKLDVNFMGIPFEVDVINMGGSGDIQTACISLMYCQPDDMTLPYHWLSQERLNWLVSEMKTHLGWP